MGRSRRAVRRIKARMPLALVTRIAWTSRKSGSGPSRKCGVSNGASKARWPISASRAAISSLSRRGRVTRTCMESAPLPHGHFGVKERPMPGKPLTILGIETSCDETAAAVVRGAAPGPGEILSNIVFSQTEAHAPYGGVVPEIASRAHLEILDGVIERALGEAKIRLADLDGIAATAGPGLIGGVMVGLTTAKALALGSGKPLIAVNHLMGHALTARLTHGVEFPFLLLLVSGGHCQLVGVGGADDFRLYGSTIDDAVGEAFDKTAKILGLPYPGGPAVEEAAKQGNPKAYDLPRPLLFKGRQERAGADFSFSGLKTAVRQLVQDHSASTEDVSASFQAAVIDIL